MTAQVLFFNDVSEKDTHLNAVETQVRMTLPNVSVMRPIFPIFLLFMYILIFH